MPGWFAGAVCAVRSHGDGSTGDIVLYLDWRHIVGLFILAIPIACIARTIVFEEIFREPRDWCLNKSRACRALVTRKFFYLFTCEYCFSHWVTLAFLLMTDYRLLYADFRGSVIAFFSLVFVSNSYLNLYSRLRVEITSEKKQIEAREKQIRKMEIEMPAIGAESGDGEDSASR